MTADTRPDMSAGLAVLAAGGTLRDACQTVGLPAPDGCRNRARAAAAFRRAAAAALHPSADRAGAAEIETAERALRRLADASGRPGSKTDRRRSI